GRLREPDPAGQAGAGAQRGAVGRRRADVAHPCRAGGRRRPDRRSRGRLHPAGRRARGHVMTEPQQAAWLDAIAFGPDGLVPAIAQQHDTGEVLMLAWMNRAAVAETIASGRACYWSRSRSRLWRKGETSGQVQRLVELRLDC